ncbi:tyrosine-type recombinase/integrase [Plantibacter sp. VKM Ac-2880]|uniref:tyrosine-type recombinase/integrase n=1 Tax=Plantibacter sp. VKM Ac-2880 TaxID=2783827 RepID=UPI00188E01BD|nr:tyrosine-type recombinase/integrase [Plantibacter sp. VKM Ac-2880]MBF4568515.1 tyrosine-type recombinase/integrase [Plantibacter sp. VKM Ac-2880]
MDVTHEHIVWWLESVGGNRAGQLAHRTSIRAFYGWAFASGRVYENPSQERSLRSSARPLAPAWEAEIRSFRTYLRGIGRSEATVSLYRERLRRFAADHASAGPFEITLDDLVEWMARATWSAEYRRGNRATLRVFYQWAVDSGRTPDSPARRLPVVKAGQVRPRPVQDDEYESALRRARDSDRLALRLAAEVGLRRAEVATVHSRDITGTPGEWTLLVHGKGDKERLLPLPESIARSLRLLPEGYAFPGQINGHVSPRYLGKRISALLPTGVTMHALRHRFATRAHEHAGDILLVQQMLGHASPATTQRYVLVSDARLRSLVEAVSQ